MDQTPNHELTLNMVRKHVTAIKGCVEIDDQVNVKLPLPETPKQAVKIAIDKFFRKEPLLGWNTYAPTFYHHNRWWIRCSAQVWNDVSISLDCGTDD